MNKNRSQQRLLLQVILGGGGALLLSVWPTPASDAFVISTLSARTHRPTPAAALFSSSSSGDQQRKETQILGLLTFDLDDTLYPIAKVEAEANEAFVLAMARYGFSGLQRDDIVRAAKEIREEIGREDPKKAAVLTHTEVRELAIRREMEKATVQKKLVALAEDEATTVEKLSPVVLNSAKK
jgi:hypothetical protein